ncbi:P-loop ATPase, Sll1717 family [Roseibium sp.]|uniref:P-loop ATPase, Sll1717 family n=1 Tax=Roseibium sp. TaxID=1936156 RepID=UPI003D131DD9
MNKVVTFDEFCNNFGFASYPFNSFTAEMEKERQAELFVPTKLYSPFYEAFEAGNTIILSGDRGTGKTSIIYDFIRRATEDSLICQIDDFSDLDKDYSEADFYRFITSVFVNSFFENLKDLRVANGNLSEEEKILLTYYYVNFASDATRGLVKRTASQIQVSSFKRTLGKLYNFIRNPLNIATNFGVSILADVVARSAGASGISAKVSEYFPEIEAGVETDLPKSEDTLEALRRFAKIARKAGFKRITLMIDKVDEDSRLENAAEEIASFIEPILTNNKFLLDENFQIIISVWIVPLNFIRERVRTQKIYSPEVRWEDDDLMRAFDRRVEVFSNQGAKPFEEVFSEDVCDDTKNKILALSNRNPRDLWHLMNSILRAQYNINADAARICDEAVQQGMTKFVKTFNFYEYYPRKANARANTMDVYSYIRHLLKLDDTVFTRNQLNEKAGTGSSTQNYTVGMENLGLITKDTSEKGELFYTIRDPKVRFAIDNDINIQKE